MYLTCSVEKVHLEVKGAGAKNESSVSIYLSRYEFPFSNGGFLFLFSVTLPVWGVAAWSYIRFKVLYLRKNVNSSFELVFF